MLQRSSPTKMKSSNLRSIFWNVCPNQFFTKNHFFTNKNIFYKQLSTKSIEIYSCMYHDVILSNRYYREKLYISILLVDNCL